MRLTRSRGPLRWASVGLALARWPLQRARARPADPRRILVLHHLLLGDTLMLTGLLAKLRRNHPDAAIAMTAAPAFAPLYRARPYGVDVIPFDPRDASTARALWRLRGFDLVVLPADNRWSWLARALGARWIVGIAGDRPAHKNWPVDELVPYSPRPCAFVETAMALVPGAAPAPFERAQWPSPAGFEAKVASSESRGAVAEAAPSMREGPFAVLHVGASTPLKLWPPDRWRSVADALHARGLGVVWSAGPGEEGIVREMVPTRGERVHAGDLSLVAVWSMLENAALLVAPDTGIAHLGRIVGVPTVTLFGPGSALMCGPGEFLARMPSRAVTLEPFACRDQRIQFFREVEWVRRCERLHGDDPDRCARPACMEAIEVAAVLSAADDLLRGTPAGV